MLTLAVDTSGLTASCAVVEDKKVVAELSTQHGKTHSQKIIPMLKTVLSMLDKSFSDVDLFAASIGPGSFTGLRIGVVTIKGLAYSLKRPVCGIPTLDSLAYSMPDFKGMISPMLDARNNQVFTAFYRKINNKLEKITPDLGIPIEEWISYTVSYNEDILILGDAVPLHYDMLYDKLGNKLICAGQSIAYQRASATALLAEEAYYKNKAVSAFELEPIYLRKSQAERMKDLKGK
ncbi:MAG: tRNA (adenosine(37)-N6)-threonylcarbamoyltransferase complex dimerization subunit type 1 TsaB [Clostridiaceae bacterium]|jgi:tRNA threonylcarbamoyladenosine biosynthesis protein TsaB|nr:tRNA (adenosine(37)-N6)-threonylcarbamoyltransferase complex dimerization subunit type 1 TsaB [Clostridiaceae bacterium]